ncbi:unnamed protein product [Absidia cylindrospora]
MHHHVIHSLHITWKLLPDHTTKLNNKQHQEHASGHKMNQQLKHTMINEESTKPSQFISTTNDNEQATGMQMDSGINITGSIIQGLLQQLIQLTPSLITPADSI